MRIDWDPAAYDYSYPEELIAHAPVHPRDAARLLAYRRSTRDITHHTFKDLPDLLEPGTLLVLNDTRVVAARFVVTKATGGAARVLFLKMRGALMEALSDRQLVVGSTVTTDDGRTLTVQEREGSIYLLQPHFDNVPHFLQEHGRMPLPPYITSPLTEQERQEEYQTVFARRDGSAAAPTASLHFSQELLDRLTERGVLLAYVTLHVGLGTFAPLTDEAITSGILHEEWYDIPPETITAITTAHSQGAKVIAVGTTATRALESAAREGVLKAGPGETALFIRPGYTFKVIDGLITNFHVPRSSLMQLVASLTGREELLSIYAEAVAERYRLFSFGDGMLIL